VNIEFDKYSYNPLYWHIKKYLNNDKIRYIYIYGGSCFHHAQKIETNNGYKEISNIKKGEYVKTFNRRRKTIEFKKVVDTLIFSNKKKCYKITLKNGNVIKSTEDHKFFYGGSWIRLKHIVSLWNGKRELESDT
jgi:intein/homing endonuclease